MEFKLLLEENDKEFDFLNFIRYNPICSLYPIPELLTKIFDLQRNINVKFHDLYIDITEGPIEKLYSSPLDSSNVTWELVFKEHRKQQLLLKNIEFKLKCGFPNENVKRKVEKIYEIHKQLNRTYDNYKMEIFLLQNSEEVAFMNFAGYKYRTIDIKNEDLMKKIYDLQVKVNVEISERLVEISKYNFTNFKRNLMLEEYPLKHFLNYNKKAHTWKDIFEQHQIKQRLLLEKLGWWWNLRDITFEPDHFEFILRVQGRLNDAFNNVKGELSKVYKEMYAN